MAFFIVCAWLYNMDLCMSVIIYIINLFLCCVCFVTIWYVCVTTVFFLSLMSIINIYINTSTQLLQDHILATKKVTRTLCLHLVGEEEGRTSPSLELAPMCTKEGYIGVACHDQKRQLLQS